MSTVTTPPLWTIDQLASFLAAFGPSGRVVSALAPTTTVRLRWLLDGIRASPKLFSTRPAWTLETDDDHRFQLLYRVDTTVGIVPFADALVGSNNVDRHVINRPLSALFSDELDVSRVFRVRTLDYLFDNLLSCEALVVGSGMAAIDLLAGARNLIESQLQVVAIDLSENSWTNAVGWVSPDAIFAALPGYLPLMPKITTQNNNTTGRFLVLQRWGETVRREVTVPLSPARTYSIDGGMLFTADGQWLHQTRRLAWNGRAPGLSLLVEMPLESSRLRLSLLSKSKDGVNIIINGSRFQPEQLIPVGSVPEWVEFAVKAEGGQDRLLIVTLAPVRKSTTARPERLEVSNIDFSGS
jgi:hypothetical protein